VICEQPSVPFLGFPTQTNLDEISATFAILGIPYGVPYGPSGLHSDAGNAPNKTRERSFRYGHQANNYDFDLDGTLFGETGATGVDCGNVPGTLDVADNAHRATSAVARLLRRGAIPVVLGGDDSIPALCVKAFEHYGPVNVLQIDAHIDFRDEVNGIRDGYSSTMRRITEMPWVRQVVQVGARGTGSARLADVVDARKAGNILIPAESVHDEGIEIVTRHIKDDLPWFVTVDVDGLDPTIAPGTSAPLPGGLSFHQARGILKHVAQDSRLAGIDFVEYFPSLDVRDTTALTVTRLLTNVMGFAARRLA
jgi:agmatinase